MSVFVTSPQAPVRRLLSRVRDRVPGARKQRVGRAWDADGWRVYLLHPKSGDKGPMLDPVSGSWGIVLNGIEELTVTVRKADLAGIERRWYTPDWGGLLLTWSENGVETPFIGAMLEDWGDETDTDLPLVGRGPGWLLDNQVIGTTLTVRDRSLGQIAWALVQRSGLKYGGMPPFVDGSPDPGGRGHERTYPAWNLANNGIFKRLTELSKVQDGPDFMFRPVWRDDDQTGIVWEFVHGTSLSPRIAPTGVPDFDTTAARSGVAALGVRSDASRLLARMWGTGAGEGEGTVVVRAEDHTLVDEGFLYLEAVMSQTDETRAHLLERDVQGALDSRVDAVDQITVRVRADDQKLGVTKWKVGDPGKLTIRGYLSVPDGTHDVRIVKASGDLKNTVTVDFQTESFV